MSEHLGDDPNSAENSAGTVDDATNFLLLGNTAAGVQMDEGHVAAWRFTASRLSTQEVKLKLFRPKPGYPNVYRYENNTGI